MDKANKVPGRIVIIRTQKIFLVSATGEFRRIFRFGHIDDINLSAFDHHFYNLSQKRFIG